MILLMNHQTLVCTDTNRQSRSGLTHPHDTFFTESFVSARGAEAAGKSLYPLPSPEGEKSTSSGIPPLVIFFTDNEESVCEQLIQSCQHLPEAFFTPPQIIQQEKWAVSSVSALHALTFTPSVNL